MKTTGYIKDSLPVLILLSLIFFGVACSKNELPEPADRTGTIILSVKNSTFQTRNGDTTEDEITQLRVIVVSQDNKVERNILFSDITTNNPQVFIDGLKTENNKKIFVVANESVLPGLNLADFTTETTLSQLSAVESTITDINISPLLMSGKIENVNLVTGINNESISLKRVAAKITIKLKKNEIANEVIVSKISLSKNTEKSTLWEGESLVSQQTFRNQEKEVSITLSETETEDYTFYLLENLGNSAVDHNNAVELIVEATFDGTPVTYRAYINSHIEAESPYNISRNAHYSIIGTVKATGELRAVTLKE